MPVAHPARTDAGAGEHELPVAATAGAGAAVGKVAFSAAAEMNGIDRDFTAGDADV